MEFPNRLARIGGDAIEGAVIGSKEDAVFPSHRSESHRSPGEALPELRSGIGVVGSDLVFTVGGEEESLATHDRFVAAIKLESNIVEGRQWFRQVSLPEKRQLSRKLLRAFRSAFNIVAPHRPVGSGNGNCGEGKKEKTECAAHGGWRMRQDLRWCEGDP